MRHAVNRGFCAGVVLEADGVQPVAVARAVVVMLAPQAIHAGDNFLSFRVVKHLGHLSEFDSDCVTDDRRVVLDFE